MMAHVRIYHPAGRFFDENGLRCDVIPKRRWFARRDHHTEIVNYSVAGLQMTSNDETIGSLCSRSGNQTRAGAIIQLKQ